MVLSPNLRYLSSNGIVLDNHYSQSVCSPARAALLTGYYPIRLGLQVKPDRISEPVDEPCMYIFKITSYISGQSHFFPVSIMVSPNLHIV